MSEPRRFSHSLISTMLDCPRKAYYRYVEGIESPKSTALVKGTACDVAWNQALEQKMAGQIIPIDELLEVTEQAFRDDVKNAGGVSSIDWGGEPDAKAAARGALASALTLTRQWATGLFPSIEPTAVQIELHRTLASGRDFIGFLDWEGAVDGASAIGDNKTGGRKLSVSEADKGLQPYAYSWLRDEPTAFVFARAIDTGKNASAEFVWTNRSEADNAWYGELVEIVEAQFDAGIFPPNPTSNLCSAKWCPYFDRCQPHRVVSGPIAA